MAQKHRNHVPMYHVHHICAVKTSFGLAACAVLKMDGVWALWFSILIFVMDANLCPMVLCGMVQAMYHTASLVLFMQILHF